MPSLPARDSPCSDRSDRPSHCPGDSARGAPSGTKRRRHRLTIETGRGSRLWDSSGVVPSASGVGCHLYPRLTPRLTGGAPLQDACSAVVDVLARSDFCILSFSTQLDRCGVDCRCDDVDVSEHVAESAAGFGRAEQLRVVVLERIGEVNAGWVRVAVRLRRSVVERTRSARPRSSSLSMIPVVVPDVRPSACCSCRGV